MSVFGWFSFRDVLGASRGVIAWGFSLILLCVQIELNQKVILADPPLLELPASSYLKPDSGLIQVLSFGQLPAWVDWIFLRAIGWSSYLRGQDRSGRSQFYYDLDLMTDLDPAFFEVYAGGALLLSVGRHEPVLARDLLLKGNHFAREKLTGFEPSFRQRFWSRPWELNLTLGYLYLFEFYDLPQAAQAIREASIVSGSPTYLADFAKRLGTPDGQFEVGGRILDLMIRNLAGQKNDPDLEKKLEDLKHKKFNLDVAQYLYFANRDYAASKKTWSEFLIQTGRQEQDPWGGVLSVNSDGVVMTSTPHESVFHLKYGD